MTFRQFAVGIVRLEALSCFSMQPTGCHLPSEVCHWNVPGLVVLRFDAGIQARNGFGGPADPHERRRRIRTLSPMFSERILSWLVKDSVSKSPPAATRAAEFGRFLIIQRQSIRGHLPPQSSARGSGRRVCAWSRRVPFCAGADSSAWLPRIHPGRCIPTRVPRGTSSTARPARCPCRRASACWSNAWPLLGLTVMSFSRAFSPTIMPA